MPPSIADSPAIEWPPPRTATVRPRSRANLTASTTSAVPVGRTVTLGRPVCIALNTSRTSARPGSAAPSTGPLSFACSSSRACSDGPA